MARGGSIPVGELVDLLGAPLDLGLEVDQLPEVVRVRVLLAACSHLHLCHWDEHLVANDLHLGRIVLA